MKMPEAACSQGEYPHTTINRKHTKLMSISFSHYYKCALLYFPSKEKWWKSEAYSNVDLNFL